jgi:hypothetical protein
MWNDDLERFNGNSKGCQQAFKRNASYGQACTRHAKAVKVHWKEVKIGRRSTAEVPPIQETSEQARTAQSVDHRHSHGRDIDRQAGDKEIGATQATILLGHDVQVLHFR